MRLAANREVDELLCNGIPVCFEDAQGRPPLFVQPSQRFWTVNCRRKATTGVCFRQRATTFSIWCSIMQPKAKGGRREGRAHAQPFKRIPRWNLLPHFKPTPRCRSSSALQVHAYLFIIKNAGAVGWQNVIYPFF